MLCNFTETNLQNYFKQPNKKNRFIFQNIFILQFYFLKIRMFFRLSRKTLIYQFIKRLLSTEIYLTKIIVLHYKEMRQQTN